MRENEKFLAFVILVAAVIGLVAVALIWPPDKDQIIRMIDSAMGGLLLALGAAANALFRSNTPAPSMEVPLNRNNQPTMEPSLQQET